MKKILSFAMMCILCLSFVGAPALAEFVYKGQSSFEIEAKDENTGGGAVIDTSGSAVIDKNATVGDGGSNFGIGDAVLGKGQNNTGGYNI